MNNINPRGILLLFFPLILAIIGLVMMKRNNQMGVILWVMAVPFFVRALENIKKKK